MRTYEVQCLDENGSTIWSIPVHSRNDGLLLAGHLNYLNDSLFNLKKFPHYNGKRIGGYTLVED